MKTLSIITAAGLLALAASCTPVEKPEYDGMTHLTFTESEDAFPNPERGFYTVKSTKSATDSPISAKSLQAHRKLNKTLVYVGYYPKEYIGTDIGEDFLQVIRTDMSILRENGCKCILRFAYSDSEAEKPWDPDVETVLRHIQNIRPILQEYGDIILTFQAGFVGVWGEWYYTDNFVSGPKTPEEHSLRKQVTDAMLEALPSDRTISLRTPMFKRMMYCQDYTDTLTVETAYNGSPRARISGFNDCFGASQNDQGTFGGSESRELWKKDSRYTLMGGETCALSKYCFCENTLQDMKDYHWTYLNSEYNSKVLSRWRTDGCMAEIEKRLGYRLALTDVYHTAAPAAGKDLNVVFKINNVGFAAPMNPRAVELILVDGKGNKTVLECNDVDPRYWFAGETVTVEKAVSIPAGTTGNCTLYLNLPDPKPTLHDNPMFSIRLANNNVWDESTGYNKLLEFTL
ncbi:MAG: DUF4832 domain-containing protein [Bacteroidales bacterium]|nr:DUF4832 domain-containing protein [Bacteroidales bacterium]